jgi:hypothetical protein
MRLGYLFYFITVITLCYSLILCIFTIMVFIIFHSSSAHIYVTYACNFFACQFKGEGGNEVQIGCYPQASFFLF